MSGRIHVGTSGWSYQHWRGPFYPADLAEQDWLAFYAERFASAEINASFYRLPSVRTLASWHDTVPPYFVFAAKASRYVTHMKKLTDPARSVRMFLDRIAALGERLGPILFQLPPRWRVNPERLSSFLEGLDAGRRYAFEFRDESWFCPEVYDRLAEHGAAFCVYELAGHRAPTQVTADFVYVRLHGPGDAYQGRYTKQDLVGWAGALTSWARQDKDVFCYFDNDQAGYAAANAAELAAMVGAG